jgi:hypothetical protein
MDNIQDQIRELQASVRRQRFAIVALASVFTGIALIGAVRPVGNATFDTITCKAWKVVDKDGRVCIIAGMNLDGEVVMYWHDKDGKERIGAGMNSDGGAGVTWYDKDGKKRITAGTTPDGGAGVAWYDKDGKAGMAAAILPDGAVFYPSKDGK